MEIRQPAGAEELSKCYRLRWEILRKPWNQPPGSETDTQESEAIHMMAVENGNVLATGRAHFISPQLAQIRYMAVAENQQGKGLGGKLLLSLEKAVREKGGSRIILNARSNAIPFYTKHGYRITGDAPMLYGSIVHVRMEKEM